MGFLKVSRFDFAEFLQRNRKRRNVYKVGGCHLARTLSALAAAAARRVHAKTCFVAAGLYLAGRHEAPGPDSVGRRGVPSVLCA